MTKLIVVFDSGVGGFSILREILEKKIGQKIIYIADQAQFPYGTKSSAWINRRLIRLINYLQPLSPSALVLACNTATVSGVHALRQMVQFPIIGVEPVIKPLAKFSKSLLLATRGTVDSPHTSRLVKKYGVNVILHTPKGLVSAIEEMDQAKILDSITHLRELVKKEKLQAIGLSCTHYPLVLADLKKTFPSVMLLDPSQAVVRQLVKVLELPLGSIKESKLEFFTTGQVLKLNTQVQSYLRLKVSAKKIIL